MAINHKLIIKLLVLVTIYCLQFNHQVNATQINFDVQNAQINQIYTVDILATPEPNENAVSIKFKTSGVELLDYQKSDGWLIAVADCDNAEAINGNLICVSLAKEIPIESKESLGKIKFKLLDKSEFKFEAIEGNGYSAGKFIREYEGNVLGINSKKEPEDNFVYLLIFGGLGIFIVFGIKIILKTK